MGLRWLASFHRLLDQVTQSVLEVMEERMPSMQVDILPLSPRYVWVEDPPSLALLFPTVKE